MSALPGASKNNEHGSSVVASKTELVYPIIGTVIISDRAGLFRAATLPDLSDRHTTHGISCRGHRVADLGQISTTVASCRAVLPTFVRGSSRPDALLLLSESVRSPKPKGKK
eukprot:COSAG02_NODE_12501_length_1536_cov_1.211552_3_plen_111_part_01